MQAFRTELHNLRSDAKQLVAAAAVAAQSVRDPEQYERRAHAAAAAALCRPCCGLAAAAREYATLRALAEAATARLVTAPVARVCASGEAVSKSVHMHALHAAAAQVLAERAAMAVVECTAAAEAAARARVRDSVHAHNRGESCMKRRLYAAEHDGVVQQWLGAARAQRDAFFLAQSVCARLADAALASGEARGRGGAVLAARTATAASARCRDTFTRHAAEARAGQPESESEAGVPEGSCGSSEERASIRERCATPPALTVLEAASVTHLSPCAQCG